MGLPDGAFPESCFDETYWAEFEREAAHQRAVWGPSMSPCPGCYHIFCEC